MKLENMNLSEKNDLKVFKALKRLIKDFLYIVPNKENKSILNFDNKTLVNKCYDSRNTHKSETINLNYTYWFHDLGAKNTDVVFQFIWLMRVINIIGDDYLDPVIVNIFKDKIRSLLTSAHMKSIDYLMENQDLLYSMTKIKSLSFSEKKYKMLLKMIETNKVGLPF